MSSDEQLIFTTIAEWAKKDVPFALATVVGVRGSTYRGLAARQLIAADGTSVGTVSGGCLDNDLKQVALDVLRSGRPALVEFDLTADDEAVWGWGIGCNGATELLVEPGPSAVELSLIRATGALAVVHGLSGDGLGAHLPISADDLEWGADALEAKAAGRHRRVDRAGNQYLLEVISGRPRLVVCGAGHDAAPLVKLGAELGFEVTVVDDRRQFLTLERFPEAASLVHCAPAELRNHVTLDSATSVVIMSHNFERDVAFLGSVIEEPVAYIGCLGPGERLERMLKDLSSGAVGDAQMKILHGPAGLDLGAEGPVEIAWSVLSEILAVRSHAAGGPLVLKKGPPELRRF